MGVSYTKTSIERLKDQVNIVDVIGRVVELKRTGANHKGLCPFHHEKTPSFMVSESRQYFNCFGCGAKGDVIEFVCRYYNMDFPEAVEMLAESYGVMLEKSNVRTENLDPYYNVNRLAARYFYRAFAQGDNPGAEYMRKRGINAETLRKFGIGYADGDWTSLYDYLSSNNVSDKMMVELGLVSESRGRIYDRFRNRVIFPILNTRGRVIGFGGRALDPDDKAKYLNSPESRVFKKKNNLYALNTTRQYAGREGSLILVEGYMDVVSLFQHGVRNVSASLGTALTENQARLLKRYTDTVILSYDADAAGRKAALRGSEILRREDCRVRVLHVTDGKDPDDFVKSKGRDAFLDLVSNAYNYVEYRLESAKQGLDIGSAEGSVEYISRAAEILSQLTPAERAVYRKKVAEFMGVSVSAIDAQINLNERNRSGKGSQGDFQRREGAHEGGSSDDGHMAEEAVRDIPALEKVLIKLFLQRPEYTEKVQDREVLLSHPLSEKIYKIVVDERSKEGAVFDVKSILDSLPENETAEVSDILKNIKVDQDHCDQVLADCLNKRRLEILEEKCNRIIAVLSMAEEGENEEEIERLSSELVRVQMDIQKLKRR